MGFDIYFGVVAHLDAVYGIRLDNSGDRSYFGGGDEGEGFY